MKTAKLLTLVLLLLVSVLHGASSMNLSKTASISTISVGTNYTYELSYNCVSDTSSCDNVVITDTLPPQLEYVGHTTSTHTNTALYDAGTQTLTYTMISPIPAGSTGTMAVTVRVRSGDTPDGTSIANTATAAGSGISDSSTATITATAADTSSLTKTLITSSYLDDSATYRLRFCAGSALNVAAAVLTDTLPAKAAYLSSTGGGVHSGEALGGTLTWNLGDLSAGACVNQEVTVSYTQANGVIDGESVTNDATVLYTPVGMVQQSRGDTLTHTVDLYVFIANPSLNVNKWASETWVRDDLLAAQAPITYYLELANSGNVDLNDTIMADDTIPFNEFDVTSFSTGTYSEPGTFEVWYRTNLTPYTLQGTYNRTDAAQVITVASLGLGGGEYITGLQWRFGSTTSAFSTTNAVQIIGDFLSPKRDTTAYVIGDSFNNTADASALYGATPVTDTEGHTISIRDNYSVPFADKSLLNSKTYQVGDEVQFRLRVRNQNTGTGDMDGEIVVADLLEPGLDYVDASQSWSAGSSTLGNPVFTRTDNYNGTGRTLLKWVWSGATLPWDSYGDLTFSATTNLKATPSSIVNTGYITNNGGSNPFVCRSGSTTISDVNDLDGDSSTADTLCKDDQSISIQALNGLDSIKWVQGVLDVNWTKYPDSGFTLPGGKADYNLTITNNGNVPANNIVIIDILPFVGDTGVNDHNDRLTIWRPNLAGEITPPAGDAGVGMQIFYSTSGNPCRDEFTIAPDCETPEWSLTPPGDITQVYSVKIVFRPDFVLGGGESAFLNWPMLAPVDAPTDGSIAWNSFAYKADKTTGGSFQPAEPNKVGIAMNPDNNATYGDTVWLDLNRDGLQDANELGVNGVIVELYDTNATLLATTTTATDYFGNMGKYLFVNLPAGDYYAKFYLPNEYQSSPANQGGDDTLDSDATDSDGDGNVSTVITPVTHLDAGEHDRTWDVGIYSDTKACIGDHVWDDANTDGIQGVSENPVGGVRVKLYDSSNNYIDVTATTIKGDYLFCGLSPNDYYLSFAPPPTFVVTRNDSGDDTLDSDVAADTNRTIVTTLSAAENDMTWDMGVYQQAQIGDFVWHDINANGIQEIGEPGIADVNVTLYYSNGTFADSMLTDASGYYHFGPREPGIYYVQFDTSNLTGAWYVSPQDAGGDDTLDSDVDPLTMRTIDTTLIEYENDPSWDMGLYQKAQLGDYVWFDTNENGQQDAAEAAEANIIVRLLDGAGSTQLAATQTDANGYYLFDALDPGDYIVEFVKPAGYTFTLANTGSDTSDSDADSTTGRTPAVNLQSGESDLSVDAGIFSPDSDSDGTLDINENCDTDPFKLEPGICGCGVADTDSDSDGTADCNDGCTSDPFKITAGSCGCGISDLDSDGDGTPNCLEVCIDDPLKETGGICGCGVADTDSDGDGVADCNDECVSDPFKSAAGVCGCGVATCDTDSDGIYETKDYDPHGYFYDEVTGEIIPGGLIEVSCDNNTTILPSATQESLDGSYNWYVTNVTANCTMSVTPPPDYSLSTLCQPLGVYQLPSSPPTTVYLGQDQNASGYIDGFNPQTYCTDNPYYYEFEIEDGDAHVRQNNIPLRKTLPVPTIGEYGRIALTLLLLLVSLYYTRVRGVRFERE